jgi:hypothetical protein
MGDSYYPAAYGGGQLDFSGIMQAAKGIAGGLSDLLENRSVRNAWEASGGDFNVAVQKMLEAGDAEGAAKLARIGSVMTDGGMTPYQREDLRLKELALTNKANEVSPEMRLWNEWNAANGGAAGGDVGAEPMRASPSQSSGVPGVGFQNAPAFITDKLAPVGEKKRLEEVGKGQGERDAKRAMLEQDVAPGMQKMIDQLIVNAKEADDTTFKHALGPLQGAGEAETWQGSVGNFLPQTWGALENYYQQGKKDGFIGGEGMNLHIKEPGELPGGFTSTVRSKINSTQASLVSVLQRALRVPGIGAQSDAELRQIINQVGELNKSRDKADFYDRLSNVVSNLGNLGIPIEMPTKDELAGVKPTDAVVQGYTQPPNQQEVGTPPSYDAAEEAPPPMQGSAVDTGSGIPGRGAPPLPATGDKNKLIYLMHNAPPEIVKQKMEEFDKLYNWPGLASIILGQARAGR